MTKKACIVVMMAVTTGVAMIGCTAQSGDEESSGEEQVATAESAYSNGTVACVDQSYASAHRVSFENDFMCPGSWNTQLSRGHRVTIKAHLCSPYVRVWSHWNSAYYNMREDALRPC